MIFQREYGLFLSSESNLGGIKKNLPDYVEDYPG